MELDLTDDQQTVADLFESFFSSESPPGVVRETERLGHSAELWRSLVATGAPSMAVSLETGGGGAGLVESVLAAEAAGRHLAPVPLAEHLVASRLLERLGDTAGIERSVAARSPSTIALHPADDATGIARLVPAGAVAAAVIARHRDALVIAETDPPGIAEPNGAGLPLAHRSVLGARPLAPTDRSAHDHGRALDEWRLLTAARLVGLTEAALASGVAYVCEREQFGVPIGSFQAVQHGLAELVAPLAGARLLVRRAAWRADADDGDSLGVDAPMALAFATSLARETTVRVIHYHGGYGVMAEYDPQLYYRRARGWPAQLGDPELELELLADRLYGSSRAATAGVDA